MSAEGGGKKKFYLLGSDYVYPRTTNKILRLYLTKVKKVPESAIAEEYTPFHHQDYQTIVGKIKSFSAAGDAAVINTINGDSNVPFFKELANQGVTADRSEEHTSELQSRLHLVCRLLLEKKKKAITAVPRSEETPMSTNGEKKDQPSLE